MAERLTGKDITNTTILKVDKDNMHIYNTTTEDGEEETVISCDAITKLGKLEDILEKYGIESVEELSDALEFAKVIEKTLSDYGIKDNEELEDKIIYYEENKDVNLGLKIDIEKLELDRDAWKRACELACGTIISEEIDGEDLYDVIEKWKVERDIEMYGFDDRFLTDYFYQQAKKAKKENDESN